MKRLIQVYIGDSARHVGSIRYEAQGARESAVFEYKRAWLEAAERFAIDPSLPLVAGAQFARKTPDGSIFHGAIADTEPDGWARRVILRDHAKRRQAARKAGAAAVAPMVGGLDFLLAVSDAGRVGALRFEDEDGVFQRASEPGRRAVPPLIELGRLYSSSRAVETNSETAADLAYLLGRGTSLGGLRPKCTVVDDDGHLCIGKFPSVADERAVTKGEVLAMKLAASAGIRVAEARLVNIDDVPIALIRRFDRSEGRRTMYISAATMLDVPANDPNEHTYTEIVDALRVHGAEPKKDIEELWRRIAFSILIANVDDHLHNHGFLHVDKGKWRLSPAFDLNPFPQRARELKTWISEDTGPEASIDLLLSVIRYFRLPLPRANAILSEVKRAVAKWRSVGSAIGMTKFELDQFADAFES